MSKWPVTAERYVAFIDIMGFRSLLQKAPTQHTYRIMKVLHDRARLAEKQAKGMLPISQKGTPSFAMDQKGTAFIRVVQSARRLHGGFSLFHFLRTANRRCI